MAKKRGGKMHKVMHEYKHGSLRRGTGKPGKKDGKVTDRKQAIAIGLNEARKAGERGGKDSKARERRLGKATL
jgi:hypothetical protein